MRKKIHWHFCPVLHRTGEPFSNKDTLYKWTGGLHCGHSAALPAVRCCRASLEQKWMLPSHSPCVPCSSRASVSLFRLLTTSLGPHLNATAPYLMHIITISEQHCSQRHQSRIQRKMKLFKHAPPL